jgi:hypothetical protein
MTIKGRTIKYLKDNKIRQKALAKDLKYHEVSMCAYLRGRASPMSVLNIERLLDLYLEKKGY